VLSGPCIPGIQPRYSGYSAHVRGGGSSPLKKNQGIQSTYNCKHTLVKEWCHVQYFFSPPNRGISNNFKWALPPSLPPSRRLSTFNTQVISAWLIPFTALLVLYKSISLGMAGPKKRQEMISWFGKRLV
jgi:hypothetical protein